MLSKYLSWVIRGGAFAAILVPLVVADSMFFPFIVGKAFAFRVIVEIMFAAWVCLALISPDDRPKRSPIVFVLAAFVVIIGLADFLGENPLRSFWSNFERMEGFFTLLHIAVFTLIVGSSVRLESTWNKIFVVSISVATALSLGGFVEVARSTSEYLRIDGTFGNSTYFAVYLLFNAFIAAFLLVRSVLAGRRVLPWLYGLAAIIHIIALYFTGTRGSLLGLVGGLGVAALIVALRGVAYPRTRIVAASVVGLIAVVAVAFFVARDSAFIQDRPTLARIANISLEDTTTFARVVLWRDIALPAFKERPLLGWGQENFIVAFGVHYSSLMYKQEPWFDRAHNVFLDWLVAGGVLGLASYLTLFIAALWVLAKSDMPLPEKSVFGGMLVAYGIHNLFVFDSLPSYIYFGLALAYLHTRSTRPAVESPVVNVSGSRLGFVATAAVVVTLSGLWFGVIVPMNRAQTLIEAIRTDYATHDPAATLPIFERALAYGSVTGLTETREQLSQAALRSLNDPAIKPEARAAIIDRALEETFAAATEEPGNTRPGYFLAHFLKQIGRSDEARAAFESLLEINPTRQMFLYELAQTYLDDGLLEEALATVKRAYDYAPESNEAFGHYVGILMASGRLGEAEALILERYGTLAPDDEHLLNAYRMVGRNDMVAAVLETRLASRPDDDPALRVSLAVIYANIGQPSKAITHLERAAELRPEFAEQAQQMIDAVKKGQKIMLK